MPSDIYPARPITTVPLVAYSPRKKLHYDVTVVPRLPAGQPAVARHSVCSPLQYNTPHQHAISHTPSTNKTTYVNALVTFSQHKTVKTHTHWSSHNIHVMQNINTAAFTVLKLIHICRFSLVVTPWVNRRRAWLVPGWATVL